MTKALIPSGLSLKELEKIIEENLLSFMVVGAALMDVRDNEKYAKTNNPDTGENYRTFTEYMKSRWTANRAYGYQCLTATIIRRYLEKSAAADFLPITERQIRPLSKLASPKQVELNKEDPEDWVRAWKRAIKLADGQEPTDKLVKKAVDEILTKRKAANLPEPSDWAGEEGIFVGNALDPAWLKELPEAAFDMLITDPPWAEDSIECYDAAGRAALKCLRPGSVAAIYFGKIYLPEVIAAVNRYLDYEWLFCFYYPESQVRIRKAAVYDCWRPVGIFRKPGTHELPPYSRDILQAPREKGTHPWQQALDPARELIRRYTKRGSIVLDPFVGGGTFPLAAKMEGRKFLAFDINEDTVKLATKRIQDGA